MAYDSYQDIILKVHYDIEK